MNTVNHKRNVNLDLLATVASFLVVFLHQAVQLSENHIYVYLYRLIAECAVPLFVMKSGTLFLLEKKNVDYRYIGKSALRISAIIVLWGLIYHIVCNILIGDAYWLATKKAITAVITAETTFNYQFWYLYMLLGLYAVTPIIRAFLHNAEKMDCTVFFLISFVVGFVIPFVCRLFNIDPQIVWVEKWFSFFSAYLLYYSLGYYCFAHPASRQAKLICFVLMILGAIITILGCNGNLFGLNEKWIAYDFPFTLVYSTLLFNLIMQFKFEKKKIFAKAVTFLASCSLGVFILHPIVIVAMRKLIHVDVTSFCPVVSIPILTVVVYAFCTIATLLIKKVPILKHFI